MSSSVVRDALEWFYGIALANDIFTLAEYGIQIDGLDSIRLLGRNRALAAISALFGGRGG